ncbi:alpha/beta hydrolase, partial [Mesorhizobium sp. M8A.F.Ca.ET.197.01.1.1]
SVRKAMSLSGGGRFLTDGANIALHLDDFDFDVARFEALAASSAPEDLERAVAVYRGDLLDGLGLREEPFEEWLRVERERLRGIVVSALGRVI